MSTRAPAVRVRASPSARAAGAPVALKLRHARVPGDSRVCDARIRPRGIATHVHGGAGPGRPHRGRREILRAAEGAAPRRLSPPSERDVRVIQVRACVGDVITRARVQNACGGSTAPHGPPLFGPPHRAPPPDTRPGARPGPARQARWPPWREQPQTAAPAAATRPRRPRRCALGSGRCAAHPLASIHARRGAGVSHARPTEREPAPGGPSVGDAPAAAYQTCLLASRRPPSGAPRPTAFEAFVCDTRRRRAALAVGSEVPQISRERVHKP